MTEIKTVTGVQISAMANFNNSSIYRANVRMRG